jgi:hypothetical protein
MALRSGGGGGWRSRATTSNRTARRDCEKAERCTEYLETAKGDVVVVSSSSPSRL